ncbi:MAG TPA: response regulator transcription factor [Acidimicrobiales bacterium]|nr:response regulator transcription factor [Acidimicrobiales bacterium]
MPADRPIRVFLLDDHEVVREGIRHLLEADGDIKVVGEASGAADAVEVLRRDLPDVAVLDVRLGDGSGIEVCREIRASEPSVACLILTSFSDDEALLDAVLAGAAGYVLKEVRGLTLIDSIRQVAAGHNLLDPDLVARVLSRAGKGVDGRTSEPLTAQESRILDLIAEGMTNRQIADAMHLAEKTIKNYVSSLLAKLGMSRRTEAAIYVVRQRNEKR